MMNNIPDLSDLIGVPFTNHGSSVNGFDCYGLAIEVERRFGHKLYDVIYEHSTDIIFTENAPKIIKQMNKKVYKTDKQKAGDIVLFANKKGEMVHIGVILNGDDFIHCDCNSVHINQLHDYFRKNYEVYTWR